MYIWMIDNVSYEWFGVFEKKNNNNVFVMIDVSIFFNLLKMFMWVIIWIRYWSICKYVIYDKLLLFFL